MVTFSKLGEFGSIGNQLFQFATVLSFGIDNGFDVVFPQKNGHFNTDYQRYNHHLSQGFDLSGFSKNYLTSGLTKYVEPFFSYNKIHAADNTDFEGYFQSHKYFEHNRKQILDSLKLKQDLFDQVLYYTSQLPKNKQLTAIHVRRGDYLRLQEFHPVLSLEYYSEAKKLITSDQAYVVFSDDQEWAQKNFPEDHWFIDSGDPFVDLTIMSCCDNFIIANSSFSWWGAWLSVAENKQIIAPKQWFGPRNQYLGTKDLLPESWIKI